MEFITTGNRIAVENFDIGKIYTITWETGNYKSLACTGKGTDFVMFQDQEPDLLFCLTMDSAISVSSIDEGGGGSGTNNYNELENKPSINGFVLVGNKTGADLGLASQSDLEDYATNASVVAGLATKQDALSSSQLAAVNSGITSTLVTQIGTNTTTIAGKQDALSSSQLAAVNSGITSADVAQITTNKNNISINSIKSSITMVQGYTLVTQSTLYQQGKHIFGNLIIKKDSGNFSNTSETVCTLDTPPAITGMVFCGFGGSEWGIESIGYAFLGSNGGVSVKDTITTNTTVNIAVDYVKS